MNAKLEPKKDPKVLAIEAKLKDRISMNMDKQPLSEAVTFLQNYTGLNIVLDPKALADEGLTSASPVSLVVNQIQLKTALKLMLQPLGLTYKVEDEVVLITSPQATQAQTITQDLLRRRPGHAADHAPQNLLPRQDVQSRAEPVERPQRRLRAQPGDLRAGRSRGIRTGFNGVGNATGERPKVDMTPIIQLITTSIAPGTWQVQDGSGQDVSSAYGLGGGFGGDAAAASTSSGSLVRSSRSS